MEDICEFLKRYHRQLNPQQQEAASRIEGATLLLAVPGSGKTTTVISRIAYMLKVIKIPVDSMLTLTFSRAGARELTERYTAIFGGEGIIPRFSTIHSFALGVIRQYEKRHHFKGHDVLNEPARLLRELFIRTFNAYPSDNDLSDMLTAISYSHNLLLPTNEIKKMKVGEFDFYRMYCAYKLYKKEHHLMDFDDMLLMAYKILRDEDALRQAYVKKYKYINVDEAQDTSKVQFKILELLARERQNIFMVGDEDQSIYGFRGAYPDGLLAFKQTYPKGEIMLMEENYRSTKTIVSSANRFIKISPERYLKNMKTDNETGAPIALQKVKNLEEQYWFILKSVEKEGKETAVLYRNNESVIPLVDVFERAGIPYKLKEHNPLFFSHFILTDLRDFIAFAMDNTDENIFSKIYYKMGLKLSKVIMQQVVSSHRQGEEIFTELENISDLPNWVREKLKKQRGALAKFLKQKPENLIPFFLFELGYSEYLDYRMNLGQKEANIEQKINILKIIAKRTKTIEEFLERLDHLKETMTSHPDPEKPRAIFSTIHSSKGLEYEKVFMIDVVDGEFPTKQALEDTPEGKRLFGEEVRLFYVGVTRAKRELEFILAPKSSFLKSESQFIDILIGKQQTFCMKDPVTVKEMVKSVKIPLTKLRNPFKNDKKKSVDISHFSAGVSIKHKGFGKGVINEINGTIATINFERHGTKKLDLVICVANELVI